MKQKRKTYWFVKPLDSHTNEIMSKHLSSLGNLIAHDGIEDKAGNKHSVYEVPDYFVITRFLKDKKKFALKFDIYYRQTNYGPIQPWYFV
jgi:hypothetical protein